MSLLWNFTIQDTSPFVAYSPFADGSFANGWQPWYTNSGFLKTPGEGGNGDSFHITSLPGAAFSLQFHGTGVDLYATTNSSYAVLIDDVEQKLPAAGQTDNLVFKTTTLENGPHNLTLTVNPAKATQQFAFDRAVVFAPVAKKPTSAFYDNTDKSLTYSGTWKSGSAAGIPNATVTHPFEQTKTAKSSVSMTFTGAVGVAINGPVLWGDWVYSVELDGKTTTHNSSTYWKVPDALRFFQAGLDPNVSHTITMANASPDMTLSLNSITLFKLPGAVLSVSDSAGSASTSASESSGPSSPAALPTSASQTSADAASTPSTGSNSSAAPSAAPGSSDASKVHFGRIGIALGCGLLLLSLI
ncbi:hypothetical protein B0H16DRAFT_1512575 [Mycena metata]|uniref:Uncharacterized protein n=1 Tax=Mycena metata TaxID=1033252 RepID=A0AAD7JUQ3_9AGAR|nr:hypothetical protein B0H16DRAFT_1512575 [Mycena metata]